MTSHEDVQLDENLSYTEHSVIIVDKEVRRLRSKDIVSVRVLWKGPSGKETTREPEKLYVSSIHTYLEIKVSSVCDIAKIRGRIFLRG